MESLTGLIQKQKELTTKIEILRKQQKKDALAQIAAIVEEYQITPTEVLSAIGKSDKTSRKRGKVPPKYRDPVSGVTWTGRGKAPAWIANKDRDAFLIIPTT